MRLTPATPASLAFVDAVRPAMDRVTGHELFRRLEAATATLAECQRALRGFYPLVVAFPTYMGETLARLEGDPRPRADEARAWLRDNMRVESNHARWWRDWGEGFGLAPATFEGAEPAGAFAGPTSYLARVSRERSPVESVAAVNYAIEGATGVWTKATLPSLARLGRGLGLPVSKRALRWVEAHARYDDHHPVEALEIVKALATDEASQEAAARAAVESLDYLVAALDETLAA